MPKTLDVAARELAEGLASGDIVIEKKASTPMNPGEKPGWQTTEFWLTLGKSAITIAMLFGMFTVQQAGDLSQQLGAAVVAAFTIWSFGATVRGYIQGRTDIKTAQITSAALPMPPLSQSNPALGKSVLPAVLLASLAAWLLWPQTAHAQLLPWRYQQRIINKQQGQINELQRQLNDRQQAPGPIVQPQPQPLPPQVYLYQVPVPAPAPQQPQGGPPLGAPPVYSPPLGAPPVYSPPLGAPPVYSPPLGAPPVYSPPLGTPPVYSPPLGAPPPAYNFNFNTPPVYSPPVGTAPPVYSPPIGAAPYSPPLGTVPVGPPGQLKPFAPGPGQAKPEPTPYAPPLGTPAPGPPVAMQRFAIYR